MTQEHREHPILYYGEVPIGFGIVILILLGIAYGGPSSKRDPAGSPTHHTPAVISPPFKDGDVIYADEHRMFIPGVEVKTGRTVPVRRHLPYDGVGPESASYGLVAGS